jgi:hypothetical protein
MENERNVEKKNVKTIIGKDKNKKHMNINNNDLYMRSIVVRKISLPINNIGKNYEEIIKNNLSMYEGKCDVEGYIKKGTIKLRSISGGMIIGMMIRFTVSFECLICCPVEGMLINCSVVSITKAGIKAESLADKPSPIKVFVARDHFYNDPYFANIKENDKIAINVIKQRFELHDPFISIIGKIVKS